MKEGFGYFQTPKERYIPKTPSTALKALEAQLLPEEGFIYLGTSIKPLDDEPVDLDEIERVLARNNLDLDTNLLLVRVLERLVKNKNAETALFAAESINRIENRYNKKIEAFKDKLKNKKDANILAELARLFFELSQIYPISIKHFYLKEAYSYLTQISKIKRLTRDDEILALKVLLELEKYDLAAGLLAQINKIDKKDDPDFLLLEAELEFKRKNFYEVLHICTRLFAFESALDESGKNILSYWMGE